MIITNMGQLFGFHVSPNCPMRYCYCRCILFVLDARMPGSRQTVSSLLTPRESHPAAPHITDATGISPCCSSQHRIAGVPLFTLRVIAESGAARYFESVVVARCRLAGRGVPLHTLFYLRSARGMYLTSDVLLSRFRSLLTATLFQQLVRGFSQPLHLFPHSNAKLQPKFLIVYKMLIF